MLDVLRYFLTRNYVLRYLDMMAKHKMSVLPWHLIAFSLFMSSLAVRGLASDLGAVFVGGG